MYKQLFNLKPEINISLLSLILLMPLSSQALTTDKDQPIEIEADTAELDDKKNVTVYSGNVIVVQGSIRMTGEKMTVYYTDDSDLETVVMTGNPATYKQLPDKSDVYDEAEAKRMEYYNSKNLIVLIKNAVVKQEGLRFSGSRIEYDTENSRIIAKGKSEEGSEAGDTSESGRVKITIKPKKKDDDGN